MGLLMVSAKPSYSRPHPITSDRCCRNAFSSDGNGGRRQKAAGAHTFSGPRLGTSNGSTSSTASLGPPPRPTGCTSSLRSRRRWSWRAVSRNMPPGRAMLQLPRRLHRTRSYTGRTMTTTPAAAAAVMAAKTRKKMTAKKRRVVAAVALATSAAVTVAASCRGVAKRKTMPGSRQGGTRGGGGRGHHQAGGGPSGVASFNEDGANAGLMRGKVLESRKRRRLRAKLRHAGGVWVIKDNDLNRGEGVSFTDCSTAQGVERAMSLMAPRGGGGAWVLQRHVGRPLLLEGKKFHIRVHALMVGDMDVFVHETCLVLPACEPFSTSPVQLADKYVHTTNHCMQRSHPSYQDKADQGKNLTLRELCDRLWHPQYAALSRQGEEAGRASSSAIPSPSPRPSRGFTVSILDASRPAQGQRGVVPEGGPPAGNRAGGHGVAGEASGEQGPTPHSATSAGRGALSPGFASAEAMFSHLFSQIKAVVADTFRAARASPLGLYPLSHCFELFGLDFLVDEGFHVWLLEVNSDPSMSIFEQRLRPLCLQLLDDTLAATVDRLHQGQFPRTSSEPPALTTPPGPRHLPSHDQCTRGGAGRCTGPSTSTGEIINAGTTKEGLRASGQTGPSKLPDGPPEPTQAKPAQPEVEDATPCFGGYHRVLSLPPRAAPEASRRLLGSLIQRMGKMTRDMYTGVCGGDDGDDDDGNGGGDECDSGSGEDGGKGRDWDASRRGTCEQGHGNNAGEAATGEGGCDSGKTTAGIEGTDDVRGAVGDRENAGGGDDGGYCNGGSQGDDGEPLFPLRRKKGHRNEDVPAGPVGDARVQGGSPSAHDDATKGQVGVDKMADAATQGSGRATPQGPGGGNGHAVPQGQAGSSKRVLKVAVSPSATHADLVASCLKELGGWQVTYNVREPLCALQWSAFADIRWERVLAGLLVANHHYSRTGLLNASQLFASMSQALHVPSPSATLCETCCRQIARWRHGSAADNPANRMHAATSPAPRSAVRQGHDSAPHLSSDDGAIDPSTNDNDVIRSGGDPNDDSTNGGHGDDGTTGGGDAGRSGCRGCVWRQLLLPILRYQTTQQSATQQQPGGPSPTPDLGGLLVASDRESLEDRHLSGCDGGGATTSGRDGADRSSSSPASLASQGQVHDASAGLKQAGSDQAGLALTGSDQPGQGRMSSDQASTHLGTAAARALAALSGRPHAMLLRMRLSPSLLSSATGRASLASVLASAEKNVALAADKGSRSEGEDLVDERTARAPQDDNSTSRAVDTGGMPHHESLMDVQPAIPMKQAAGQGQRFGGPTWMLAREGEPEGAGMLVPLGQLVAWLRGTASQSDGGDDEQREEHGDAQPDRRSSELGDEFGGGDGSKQSDRERSEEHRDGRADDASSLSSLPTGMPASTDGASPPDVGPHGGGACVGETSGDGSRIMQGILSESNPPGKEPWSIARNQPCEELRSRVHEAPADEREEASGEERDDGGPVAAPGEWRRVLASLGSGDAHTSGTARWWLVQRLPTMRGPFDPREGSSVQLPTRQQMSTGSTARSAEQPGEGCGSGDVRRIPPAHPEGEGGDGWSHAAGVPAYSLRAYVLAIGYVRVRCGADGSLGVWSVAQKQDCDCPSDTHNEYVKWDRLGWGRCCGEGRLS
eukprot:jgi/Mesvir1/9884/Mv22414-RA.2